MYAAVPILFHETNGGQGLVRLVQCMTVSMDEWAAHVHELEDENHSREERLEEVTNELDATKEEWVQTEQELEECKQRSAVLKSSLTIADRALLRLVLRPWIHDDHLIDFVASHVTKFRRLK